MPLYRPAHSPYIKMVDSNESLRALLLVRPPKLLSSWHQDWILDCFGVCVFRMIKINITQYTYQRLLTQPSCSLSDELQSALGSLHYILSDTDLNLLFSTFARSTISCRLPGRTCGFVTDRTAIRGVLSTLFTKIENKKSVPNRKGFYPTVS